MTTTEIFITCSLRTAWFSTEITEKISYAEPRLMSFGC